MVVSKLKIERTKRGINQVDLFMKTGIPQWRLSLIERGIAPRPEEARRIAEALGVQIGDLFEVLIGDSKNQIPPIRQAGDGLAGS